MAKSGPWGSESQRACSLVSKSGLRFKSDANSNWLRIKLKLAQVQNRIGSDPNPNRLRFRSPRDQIQIQIGSGSDLNSDSNWLTFKFECRIKLMHIIIIRIHAKINHYSYRLYETTKVKACGGAHAPNFFSTDQQNDNRSSSPEFLVPSQPTHACLLWKKLSHCSHDVPTCHPHLKPKTTKVIPRIPIQIWTQIQFQIQIQI